IAEDEVVAHREHRQHQHPRDDAVVVGGQHELRGEQQRDDAEMDGERPQRRGLAHRGVVPNRPCGRNTSTMATASVAMILASVGEKKTEMMPSDRPTSRAATTVPRSEPSPPMMTTMKES